MSGERVLVTGATGTIGRRLIEKLIAEKKCVAVLVRDVNKSRSMFSRHVVHMDYTNDNWRSEIKKFKPEVIIHLASYSTSHDDIANITNLIESNIVYLSMLLESLDGLGVKLFINSGSFSEYKNNDNILAPAYFYSATKICSRYIIDYYSSKYDFKFMQCVLYSVYGGDDSGKKIFDLIIESLGCVDPIELSDGKQSLDFVHVDDIVEFFNLSINDVDKINRQYEEYHLGTGKGLSIRGLAALASEVTGVECNIKWGGKPPRSQDIHMSTAKNNSNLQSLEWEPIVKIKDSILKEHRNRLNNA